jgi:DHA2 family multidrug resistance protein
MINKAETPFSLNIPMITLCVMMATVMQVLDTTIANVALPHMQGSLSATQDQITWVLTSYIVASAIMTPATGWLVGRWGRKKIFLLSIAGFTSASFLCGIAQSMEEMVIFRLLQGVFGAALVPISQSTLFDINPPEKHGSAMALWGMGIMIGPILGPTLGGYLTEYYDWRWVFYINLPIGILSFLGISIYLPDTARENRPFDISGFICLSFTLASLQLMLDRGEQVDWFSSIEIWIYVAVMCGAFWIFLVHVRTAIDPFLTLSIFKDLNFVAGLILIFFVGVVLLATMALLPPYMQNIMGYQVVDVGILMAPRGVGTMIAMMIVGKLTNKVDARAMILLGLSLTAISLWEMAEFNTFVPEFNIIRSGVTQGLGIGFIFVPLSTVAFATLPPNLRTEGASLFSLLRNLGSSIGVSYVTALLSQNTQINHSYLGESITETSLFQALSMLPDAQQILSPTGLGLINTEVTKQAATIAYLNDFKLMMWLTLAIIPLLFFLRKPTRKISKPDIHME